MDLYLDPTTRDLAITPEGLMRLTSGVPESAAQRILITLLMFAGEWFLDLRAGVPYYQEILVKNPDLDSIRTLYRQTVEADPYVVDVTRVDMQFDPGTRSLTVDLAARLREGTELEILISQGLVNGSLVVNGVQVVVNGIPVVVNG